MAKNLHWKNCKKISKYMQNKIKILKKSHLRPLNAVYIPKFCVDCKFTPLWNMYQKREDCAFIILILWIIFHDLI